MVYFLEQAAAYHTKFHCNIYAKEMGKHFPIRCLFPPDDIIRQSVIKKLKRNISLNIIYFKPPGICFDFHDYFLPVCLLPSRKPRTQKEIIPSPPLLFWSHYSLRIGSMTAPLCSKSRESVGTFCDGGRKMLLCGGTNPQRVVSGKGHGSAAREPAASWQILVTVTYIYSSTTHAGIQRSAIVQGRQLRGCWWRSLLCSFSFELQCRRGFYSRGWAGSSSNQGQNSE